MSFRKKVFGSFFVLSALTVAGCGGEESTEDADTDGTEAEVSSGGELDVALDAQPSILDIHLTTESVTSTIGRHIFEGLMAADSSGQPEPMLAESVDINDANDTYTFHLREGIMFHNGEEMTADDVVASMNRWKEQVSGARNVIGDDDFEAIDDYTVELSLSEPSALVLTVMVNSMLPAIMPEELIEEAGSEPVSEFVGTGPFQFEDWSQDQHIHVSKFEDYQPVDGEPDGEAGEREALVNDIFFHFVSDPSTRMSGMQTGEYDVNAAVPYDNYEMTVDDPNMETVSDVYGSVNLYYNNSEGTLSDLDMRQAVNAALNMDAIMEAAYSYDELYELEPGYIHTSFEGFHSEAGTEAYNQNDLEAAEQFLADAGYEGEEIVLLTTRDYEDYYNAAVVIQEQLSQIGVNVELEVYDWATLLELRDDPANWDMFISGAASQPTPLSLLPLDSDYAGWTDHETIDELLEVTRTAPSEEEAQAAWDELQEFAWTEYLPITVLGYYHNVSAVADEVEGYTTHNTAPVLWNTRIED